MLDSLKGIHATDIPVKLIKDTSIFFVEEICAYSNESIGKGQFSNLFEIIQYHAWLQEECIYFKKELQISEYTSRIF